MMVLYIVILLWIRYHDGVWSYNFVCIYHVAFAFEH